MELTSFLRLDTPPVARFTYQSELTRNSGRYSRELSQQCTTGNHYYQALRIDVSAGGHFEFQGESMIGTYGYLYHDTFDTLDPPHNLIAKDFDGCGYRCFWLRPRFLQKTTTYILVVTTYWGDVAGAFNIIAVGNANISFFRLSEYHGYSVFQQQRHGGSTFCSTFRF